MIVCLKYKAREEVRKASKQRRRRNNNNNKQTHGFPKKESLQCHFFFLPFFFFFGWLFVRMQEQGLPLKEAVFCFFVSIATILGTGVVEGTRKWSGQRKKFPSAPGIFSACVLCFSFLSPTSLLLCRHLGPASEAVRMWLWSFCGDLSICAVGSGTRAGDCQ